MKQVEVRGGEVRVRGEGVRMEVNVRCVMSGAVRMRMEMSMRDDEVRSGER